MVRPKLSPQRKGSRLRVGAADPFATTGTTSTCTSTGGTGTPKSSSHISSTPSSPMTTPKSSSHTRGRTRHRHRTTTDAASSSLHDSTINHTGNNINHGGGGESVASSSDQRRCLDASLSMLHTSMENAKAYEYLVDESCGNVAEPTTRSRQTNNNSSSTGTRTGSIKQQPQQGENDEESPFWMGLISKLEKSHLNEKHKMESQLQSAKAKTSHYKVELRDNLQQRLQWLEHQVLHSNKNNNSCTQDNTTSSGNLQPHSQHSSLSGGDFDESNLEELYHHHHSNNTKTMTTTTLDGGDETTETDTYGSIPGVTRASTNSPSTFNSDTATMTDHTRTTAGGTTAAGGESSSGDDHLLNPLVAQHSNRNRNNNNNNNQLKPPTSPPTAVEVTIDGAQVVQQLWQVKDMLNKEQRKHQQEQMQHQQERQEWMNTLGKAAAVTADGQRMTVHMEEKLQSVAAQMEQSYHKQKIQYKEKIKVLEQLLALTEQQHQSDIQQQQASHEETKAQLTLISDDRQRQLDSQTQELAAAQAQVDAAQAQVAQLLMEAQQNKNRGISPPASPPRSPRMSILKLDPDASSPSRRVEWDDKLDRAMAERDIAQQELVQVKAQLERIVLKNEPKQQGNNSSNRNEASSSSSTEPTGSMNSQQLKDLEVKFKQELETKLQEQLEEQKVIAAKGEQELTDQFNQKIERLEIYHRDQLQIAKDATQEVASLPTGATKVDKRLRESVAKRNELVSRLRKMEEQHADDKGSWKLKLETALSHNRRLESNQQSLSAELGQVRKELQSQREAHELKVEELQAKCNRHQKELQSQRQAHAQKMEELQAECNRHQKEKEEIMNEAQALNDEESQTWRIRTLEEEESHTRSLKALETRHDEALQKLRAAHSKEIATLFFQHEQDEKEWRQQLGTVEEECDQRSRAVQEACTQEADGLRRQIQQLKSEVKNLGVVHEREISSQHEHTQERAQAERIQEMAKVRLELQEQSQVEQDALRAELEAQALVDYDNGMAQVRMEFEARAESEQDALRAELEAQARKEHEEGVSQLRKDFEELNRIDMEALRQQLEERARIDRDEMSADYEARIQVMEHDLQTLQTSMAETQAAHTNELTQLQKELTTAQATFKAQLDTKEEELLRSFGELESLTREKDEYESQLHSKAEELQRCFVQHDEVQRQESFHMQTKAETLGAQLDAQTKAFQRKEAEYADQLDVQTEAFQRKQAEFTAQLDAKEREHDQARAEYDKRLVEIQKQLHELGGEKAEYRVQIESLEQELHCLQERLVAKNEEQDKQKMELSDLRIQREKEANEWHTRKEGYEFKIASLENVSRELQETIRERHEREIANLNQQIELKHSEVTDQSEKRSNDLARLEGRLATITNTHSAELDVLHQRHNSEMIELRRQLNVTEDRFDKAEQRHREEIETKQKALDKARAETNSVMDRVNELSKSLDEMRETHRAAKSQLTEKVARVENERDVCQRELEFHKKEKSEDTSVVEHAEVIERRQEALCATIVDMRNELVGKISSLQNTTTASSSIKESAMIALRDDISSVQTTITEAVAEMANETKSGLESGANLSELVKQVTSVRDLLSQQKNLVSEIGELRSIVSSGSIGHSKESEELIRSNARLQHDLDLKQEALAKCNEELANLREQLSKEHERRDHAEEEITKLNDQADAYSEELMHMQAVNTGLEETLREAEKRMERALQQEGVDINTRPTTSSEEETSPLLEEALALAEGLTDIVHGRGEHSKESSVMSMLESLSELMDQHDSRSGILPMSSSVEIEESTSPQHRHLFFSSPGSVEVDFRNRQTASLQVLDQSRQEPEPVTTPQHSQDNSEPSKLSMVVDQLYDRCQLLERERTELMEVSMDLLQSAKESSAAELDAALAIARRKAAEEMEKIRSQTYQDQQRLFHRLCGTCQSGLLLEAPK